MATSPKHHDQPPATLPPKPVAEKPARSDPYLCVYFSHALHKKVLSVIDKLEASPEPEQHRTVLAEVIIELMNAGMDYCFMRPLKMAKPGFIIEQTAGLGLSGALQVLGTVIRNIMGRMNGKQLLSVCTSIRQLMRVG